MFCCFRSGSGAGGYVKNAPSFKYLRGMKQGRYERLHDSSEHFIVAGRTANVARFVMNPTTLRTASTDESDRYSPRYHVPITISGDATGCDVWLMGQKRIFDDLADSICL